MVPLTVNNLICQKYISRSCSSPPPPIFSNVVNYQHGPHCVLRKLFAFLNQWFPVSSRELLNQLFEIADKKHLLVTDQFCFFSVYVLTWLLGTTIFLLLTQTTVTDFSKLLMEIFLVIIFVSMLIFVQKSPLSIVFKIFSFV